ncbi:cupredoxin domain-containing protein [Gorillibacterium massiliense]|uniref:cupredoxin domain-containing protein n=1 Tax=Gorillibacterium massiliense TaxID=1280390 RepID=UPI0004BA7659|nr:cupredoxin domain-containing protein [Gorillibacterium massiliense]
MFTTIRIRKRTLAITALLLCLMLVTGFYLKHLEKGSQLVSALLPGSSQKSVPAQGRVIDLVTGEFESTMDNGKMIEAYRWDPSTIPVEKGETITLRIRGISGGNHPFIIEGLGVSGTVEKGKTSSYTFTPTKKGVYRMVCMSHEDAVHDGPMVAYLIVN